MTTIGPNFENGGSETFVNSSHWKTIFCQFEFELVCGEFETLKVTPSESRSGWVSLN